jgi:hypothetical protein
VNRRSEPVVLAIVAVSTPTALAAEALVRRLLLPPELEEMREWLHPKVAPVGWALVAWRRWRSSWPRAPSAALRGRAREQPATLAEAERAGRARMETMLLTTSVAQVPALLGTVAFTFGADPLATWLTIGIGTLGVVAQWPALRRLGR